MRDKNRIRPFCERLAEAWERCPDMRFGQFVSNVYAQQIRDPFFIEDDESIHLIERMADRFSPYYPPKELSNGTFH